MIYTIKRLSKVIEEKLFGKSNEPINVVQDVYMETIKLVEMWRSFSDNKGNSGVNTPHWINHLADKMWDIGDKSGYTFQCFYIPLDNNINNIKGKAGVFGREYSKGRPPEKIIEDEINYVLNLKESGSNKYRSVINFQGGISRTPKDYLYFFKYLALSLSGQYTAGPWDNTNFIEKTIVDYTKQGLKFNSPSELQRYLEHLFVEYLGPNDFIEGF